MSIGGVDNSTNFSWLIKHNFIKMSAILRLPDAVSSKSTMRHNVICIASIFVALHSSAPPISLSSISDVGSSFIGACVSRHLPQE